MNRGGVFTKLNLHLFLLAVVVAVDIFIGVRFALAWRAVRSNQTSAFVQEEARLGQLESQMRHLNNLPKKVDAADEDAQRFYDARNFAELVDDSGQLGAVATKNQVRLSRAAYAENPAAAGGLTELHIDAGFERAVLGPDAVHQRNRARPGPRFLHHRPGGRSRGSRGVW